MTNGDKLRAMTDKEIAVDRVHYQYGGSCSADEGEYYVGDFGRVTITNGLESHALAEAIRLEIEWLKQETKEAEADA